MYMYVRYVRRSLAAVGGRFHGCSESKRYHAHFMQIKSTTLRHSVDKMA